MLSAGAQAHFTFEGRLGFFGAVQSWTRQLLANSKWVHPAAVAATHCWASPLPSATAFAPRLASSRHRPVSPNGTLLPVPPPRRPPAACRLFEALIGGGGAGAALQRGEGAGGWCGGGAGGHGCVPRLQNGSTSVVWRAWGMQLQLYDPLTNATTYAVDLPEHAATALTAASYILLLLAAAVIATISLRAPPPDEPPYPLGHYQAPPPQPRARADAAGLARERRMLTVEQRRRRRRRWVRALRHWGCRALAGLLLLLLLAAAFAAVYALALGLVLLLSQAAVHGPALYRTVSSLRNYSPHAVLSAGVHAASLGAAPGAG
ncbi:hypothetical protein EMIHUDRAFT_444068 [Emiliania huxleyi CCMP1516]|uniref:PRA1 family protein n=2 Tax=Emiliania huxleyi TaxID=2903 RepID=A0A0D3JJ77_EMIH1|nr:hypothetical protein EMIHUDRAFT_444068 [Emiliania huxleyi CCMP1516]EOD23562.1 hypothetical protein EMIHUDRAFT_444068 [Emiliania huxleyi CCMP1516]|eukprot:XP_005775991.1 hypothetical protein EMIHUDRAFT_444068 [Emiliania huxleyi CCMP1516]